jgi:hypothetical protein
MVEAKIRVEALESRNNPTFYGNTLVKKVTEESLMHDYDKRENVAPFGVIATIKVASDVVLDIRVNRYYFDYEGSGGYVAFFSIEEKVYEVWVKFDENNDFENLWLSEWLQSGDFENGDDADNIYKMEAFTTYAKFLS